MMCSFKTLWNLVDLTFPLIKIFKEPSTGFKKKTHDIIICSHFTNYCNMYLNEATYISLFFIGV